MTYTLEETAGVLTVAARMAAGMRVVLLALALFPLLAPYELLFRVHWTDYFNLFFLFAAGIVAGALAVSALLAWAGLAGLNVGMSVDRTRGVFAFTSQAPVVPRRTVICPLADLASVE